MMKNLRHVLAFDTAMAGCSAAVLDMQSGESVAETRHMERGQSESLVPLITDVLKKAHMEFSMLDLIAVTAGPGAFTGLRIGLSTARALSLALERPVAGLTTLEVIARQFRNAHALGRDEILAVILETKRQDFYLQTFTGDEALSEPEALLPEEISSRYESKKVVFTGDALARFQTIVAPQGGWRFVPGFELPDPVVIARMAAAGKGVMQPEPVYLRGADVTISTKPARVLKDFY